MKRCGQWLFLLWVATALLYPQAVTAVAPAHDQTARLSLSQVQSLPLLADLSFKENGKVETKPCMTPDHSAQVLGETSPPVALPVMASHCPPAATSVRPVTKGVRGRFPFACAPPAQS